MRTCDQRLKCTLCAREITRLNMSKHMRWHEKHPIEQNSSVVKAKRVAWNKGLPAWNKGLTKETCEALRRQGQNISLALKGRPGRKQTEETKRKISLARKQYLIAHPDKIPYLLNHSSKASYPELYFQKTFKEEHIDLLYHHRVGLYELDFCSIGNKIDIEIDGEQHYYDPRIVKHDIERTKKLESLGWRVYRVRWSDYRKSNIDKKKEIVEKIRRLATMGR